MLLDAVEGDLSSRQMYLKQILSALPLERPERGRGGVFAGSRTTRGAENPLFFGCTDGVSLINSAMLSVNTG